jgi:hypothetical protein
MTKEPNFNLNDAHRHFAAYCFNKTWDLIDKKDRTVQEDEAMIQLSQASLWHWTQRDDCSAQNLAVGYWQVSRVYALLGQAGNARKYGQLSLEFSEKEPPFYRAYALEALARAAMVAGDRNNMLKYIREARQLADSVADPEEKKLLLADVESIA